MTKKSIYNEQEQNIIASVDYMELMIKDLMASVKAIQDQCVDIKSEINSKYENEVF